MRVLLSGYYGFGNAGDEAVLESLLGLLRSTWSDMHPVVLSADPADTSSHHGVTALSRWRPDVFLRELHAADLFLSGGGSLFQDATSARSLAYYLAQMELARWVGVPRVVAFQGIGPLRTAPSRVAVTAVLQDASALIVRDRPSADLLREVGVLAPPTRVAADPAVMLEPDNGEVAIRLLEDAGVPDDRPLLAVSLRPWPGIEEFLDAICEALRAVRTRWGLSIVLLPMRPDEDRELSLHVASAVDGQCLAPEDELPPATLLALLARCHLVLGMRLHALIFAVAAGVPTVGLSYDPKVDAFLHDSRQACAGDATRVTTTGLVDALDQSLSQRDAFAAAAVSARDRMRQSVTDSMRWLVEQLP